MEQSNTEILEVINVCKTYKNGYQALNKATFTMYKGDCLGLVGESGSGKSTLARCLLTLDKITSGEIFFLNQPMHLLQHSQIHKMRKHMHVVFQNPATSFNNKLSVMDCLLEPLRCREKGAVTFLGIDKLTERQTAELLLEKVHLSIDCLQKYPDELSGGQKQRIAIARAISVQPQLIVLDEPTTSLDASIQARILNLLKDLQEQFNLSYLFISHDLEAVNFMSNRIAVMKEGTIVDDFSTQELFSANRHEYTKQLVALFDN